MSLEHGLAAMRLEAPPRVPRTEYSAHIYHFDLVKAVTGIEVDNHSSPEERAAAGQAFVKAWNYDYMFATNIQRREFGDLRTDMGHAVYQSEGVDKREIGQCPFKSVDEVLAFDPMAAFGRKPHGELVQRFEDHYRSRCEQFPECVNTGGVYISLISGMIDLFGWELLLTACGSDPEGFGELQNRYARWVQQYMDALADVSFPVIQIHDDMVITAGPIFHPDWYRTYVFPNFKKYFAPMLEAGKRVLFCSDGDYTMFVDDLARAGAGGFVFEPMTDLKTVVERYGQTHVIVGNADTRILLSGTREAIRAEVERCMNLGKPCPGYFLAVGNHIPPNTPVENALYYNEVYEELGRR